MGAGNQVNCNLGFGHETNVCAVCFIYIASTVLYFRAKSWSWRSSLSDLEGTCKCFARECWAFAWLHCWCGSIAGCHWSWPPVITIPPSMKIRWKILCLVALVIEITLHFFRVNHESDMITGSVVRAATGIQTHAAAILWVSHPAGRQKESDPPRTTLLPTFYFWVAPIPPWTLPQPTHGYPTHGSPPTADSQPLKADSHSCSPTLTLPWVSIQSEIPGRNSAAQSVRSQCGDFLTPFAVWAATGIRTHLLRSSESAI